MRTFFTAKPTPASRTVFFGSPTPEERISCPEFSQLTPLQQRRVSLSAAMSTLYLANSLPTMAVLLSAVASWPGLVEADNVWDTFSSPFHLLRWQWKLHKAYGVIKEEPLTLTSVNPGETIQPHPLQIYISTVVARADFPAVGGFNLFLNGWAKYQEDSDFQCCLAQAGYNGSFVPEVFTQVKSWMYHQFTNWIVDMQASEFSCSISREQLSALGIDNFSHVALVQHSCLEAPSVGVCLKVSYGTVGASQLVEWMEYQRMMAVSSVFTYTSDLDPPAQAVVDYYVRLGFLTALPAHPPPSKGGPARGFRRPRYETQAWVDEIWAANDCKHRMGGYDYLIVMDVDEFIVPQRGLETYRQVLDIVKQIHPYAGGFSFDSHVMLLDWGATRDSPLQVGKYTLCTKEPNYDGFDRNSRWASIPDRTFFVLNNLVVPRKPYVTQPVPPELYRLLHYRRCKPQWTGCHTRQRLQDQSMLRHERSLVERILALPGLDSLLYADPQYVLNMRHWLDTVGTQLA
ncbi:hypothetical protein EGW08_015464 [Elysia chlorotica]|uniref:Glycosyltransferase family 92 protein n=1 Tax=Elysia chlorotica TaxID=188477 RepID=A0A3S0ZG23_ELYCH|nr:hypothetical protein EGW08_015464 [Elysia chlorotica]